MRLFTKILFSLLALLTGLSSYYFVHPDALRSLAYQVLNTTQQADTLLDTIQQQLLLPAPLRGSTANPGQTLTIADVLAETNRHRQQNNQPALSLHQDLNAAAASKLTDMFRQQFFDHVSPEGVGPADIVDYTGYRYLRVGENLALGNYAGDADLVQAWMDSPGHRANILSPGFTEIGIAVGEGQFEGQHTWLAVQTFALPADACPQLDEALHQTFTDQKTYLSELSDQQSAAKNDLQDRQEKITAFIDEAARLFAASNEKIAQGNKLIQQSNDLVRTTNTAPDPATVAAGQSLQATGQTLREQALTANQSAEQLNQTQAAQLAAYNQQITAYNQLNEQLAELADQINRQIRQYNDCAKKYMD